MRMTKWNYYADFVLYPPAIVGLVATSPWHARPWGAGSWFASMLIGMAGWTLLEYALHRWVLHQLPPFKRLHTLHHARPGDLIGTPAWLSAGLFLGLWSALAHESSPGIAGGITTGLMTGYLAYTLVHYATHHLRSQPGSWLYGAKLRHALHHRAGTACNFGVSTRFWDAVFRTGAVTKVTTTR